ncbi:MAG: 6-bladed beta-propeller [Tannerellaceae bacterium]
MRTLICLSAFVCMLNCSNKREPNSTSTVAAERDVEVTDVTAVTTDENIRPKDRNLAVYSKIDQYTNNLSAIASDVEFVHLDDEPLLRDFFVHDMQRTDDYIFVMGSGSIHQYNLQGKYIRPIGRSGQGPGEYVNLSAPLLIDEDKKEISVLDLYTKRMPRYNFDGKFLKSVRMSDDLGGYLRMDSTTFIARTFCFDRFLPNVKSLELKDQNFKTIKSFDSYIYPIEVKGERYGPEYNALWRCNDDFYTLEYGNDTVFQVTRDALIPSLILSGELALEKDELFKKKVEDKVYVAGPLMKPNSYVFESNRFLLFRMNSGNDCYFVICDKLTGELSRTGKHSKRYSSEFTGERSRDYFIDDIVSSMCVSPLYYSNGYAIGLIPAMAIVEDREQILQYIQSHPTKEGEKLAEIVRNITEEDNSIACFIRFK